MEPERRPQFIVAYDFSPTSEEALTRAIDAASRAPQHVLHVVIAIDSARGLAILPTDAVDYPYADKIQALAADRIGAALAGRGSADRVNFFIHARIGKPADEILDLADEIGADLIFIGSHGRTGVRRALLGSVSEHVVREARCPVMVARQKSYKDVELEKVVTLDRPAHRYIRPHRYEYADRRMITRSDDWPVS